MKDVETGFYYIDEKIHKNAMKCMILQKTYLNHICVFTD